MKKKLKRLASRANEALSNAAIRATPVLAGLATVVVIGAIVAIAGAKGPQWHGDYLRSKVGTVTLKIVKDNTERSGGTGFVVHTDKGNDYILTNAHVCAMSTDGSVLAVTPDGSRRMPRRIIEVSENHDLCLVETIPNLKGVSLAAKGPAIGEIIAVIGHPRLYPLTLSRGEFRGYTIISLLKKINGTKEECSGARDKFIEFPPESLESIFGVDSICITEFTAGGTSAQIFPGSSGSPSLNFYGNLIGVVFAGDRSGASGFFVPLEDVKAFLAPY